MRIDGLDGVHRIKVRNLSSGGMMGEGPVRVARGAQVEVEIRNVGWIEGSVAWVQDTRFGVAFREDIDPKVARAPVGTAEDPAPPPMCAIIRPSCPSRWNCARSDSPALPSAHRFSRYHGAAGFARRRKNGLGPSYAFMA
ncbi:PilZ domain-containing protein [Novosphingobium colocasiae]